MNDKELVNMSEYIKTSLLVASIIWTGVFLSYMYFITENVDFNLLYNLTLLIDLSEIEVHNLSNLIYAIWIICRPIILF
jgi:hypothetical protein